MTKLKSNVDRIDDDDDEEGGKKKKGGRKKTKGLSTNQSSRYKSYFHFHFYLFLLFYGFFSNFFFLDKLRQKE